MHELELFFPHRLSLQIVKIIHIEQSIGTNRLARAEGHKELTDATDSVSLNAKTDQSYQQI